METATPAKNTNLSVYSFEDIENLVSRAMKNMSSEMKKEAYKRLDDVRKTIENLAASASKRTIIVTYDPAGDVDDIDYVNVTVEPENDADGANDNIALLLAAAKILARTCPGIDEEAYGGMLLEGTEDWMKSVVLDALIGGAFNGKC